MIWWPRNSAAGFNVSDAGITVTAEVDGKVAASQLVPATIDGPGFDAGFNAGYLSSLLSGFGGEVRIAVKVTRTESAPDEAGERHELVTVMKPAALTADGDTFTGVIMPVRKKS